MKPSLFKNSFGLGSFINLALGGADAHFSAECKYKIYQNFQKFQNKYTKFKAKINFYNRNVWMQ